MIIGTTGPTVFNEQIQSLVEDFYGCMPLYIHQNDPQHLEWVLKNIKGLIVSGGRDLAPMTYRQEVTNGDALSNFDYKRDNRELYLIKRCLELNIPILGICRGHQLLGVYHKLTLIKNVGGSDVCHSPREKIDVDGLPGMHFVYCLDDYIREFFSKEYVNSYHHQALWFSDTPKGHAYYKRQDVEVMGYAHLEYSDEEDEDKKIIELMGNPNKKWISCQWHPECEPDYEPNAKVLNVFGEWIGKI